MRITRQQLRRIIKEVHAEYEGLPQSDIDYYELADDYALWVKENGHITPAASSVMATYFLEQGLEDDHGKHEMLGKAFGVNHNDIMSDIRRQKVETLSESMPQGGVPDVVGAVTGVTGEKRRQLMDALEKKYNLDPRTTEEFDGSGGGIWLSGEDGNLASDGIELFDSYAGGRPPYDDFGVHTEFNDFIEQYGFFAEWYDAGTLMLYRA